MSDKENTPKDTKKDVAKETPKDTPKKGTGENVMRSIKVSKVIINMGVGESGDKLQRAEKVIELLTGGNPVRTISNTTNKDLGIRKGQPIGCKITLREDKAVDFVKSALDIRQFKLPDYCFDSSGNLSFGIPDYTDFEGQKYDPEIGIFGMDINVVLERPGYRVSRRHAARRKVRRSHRVTPEEAKKFIGEFFGVEVVS
jgi:large subunit ribosomal protein L5